MNRDDRHPRIELRGVRVHNLKNIDLDLPLGRLIVVTGVSGAGKSSLVFDTLFAEGQRRYVESFSTYARRFLERFEKPDADRIEPIPPAVAVRQKALGRSRRATVGTITEIYDSLRLLFARVGVIECPACRRRVERHTPASAQTALEVLEPGTRFMVCFPVGGGAPSTPAAAAQPGCCLADAVALSAQLADSGFTRLIIGGRTVVTVRDAGASFTVDAGALVVVDRLTAGASTGERLADSLELAFQHGGGACVVLAESPTHSTFDRLVVDGVEYNVLSFNSRLACPGCGAEFADPEPALFNFNSPLGACPQCRGTGEVEFAMKKGAGTDPQGSSPRMQGRQHEAGPSFQRCPSCEGARQRPEALAVRVAGRTIVDLTRLTAAELLRLITGSDKMGSGSEPGANPAITSGGGEVPLLFLADGASEQQRQLSAQILAQTTARLEFLIDVGLGYLTLDRPARTLSGGETQRVRLTAAFGSKFVNMLYVLDEPTAGLHPCDTARLLAAIKQLRDAGNTVVIVEHDSTLIRHADQVFDIGPGAGRDGGRVVFQGTPK
ncbi:MAG: excinuclease ABC subunit A, partial [Deltaproteobacteria bacterium]